MMKVVIVDDEPSVLEGLRLFVDWNKEGYEIVAEASDGLSAFPLIREFQPDLVICDICMPGLNGLDLIEKINAEIEPVPKFIMLSGYNDFAYARKALELGAVGYLTKPLDSDELELELARVTAMIENDKKTNREQLEMLRYAANQTYNELISGKRSDKLIRKARFLFGLPENQKMRLLWFIVSPNQDFEFSGPPIYDLLVRACRIQNESCAFYNGNGVYVVLLHEGLDPFPSYNILRENFMHQFHRCTQENPWLASSRVLISGLGGPSFPEGLLDCGKQLDQLHIWCMLHPDKRVFFFEELDTPSEQDQTNTEAFLPEQAFEQVVAAIQGNEAALVTSAVDGLFNALNQNTGKGSLSLVCLYRLGDVVRKTASLYGIEAGGVIQDFTRAVSTRSPNCRKLAATMCMHVFHKLNSNLDKPIVLLENEIIEYIKANCRRKNLSIQTIAEVFSIPGLIVSKIVKKKSKYKFNDYLNSLRIEYAKMLFATEDMKITAVCDEAGYSDYGYFTRKFKEFTGVLPSEDKKKYS